MENENKWEYDYSASNNETGYPNVGSSGMNTANQYNEPEAQPVRPAYTAPADGGSVPPTPPEQPQYSAPEQPEKPRRKKKFNGGKLARSAVALVLAAASSYFNRPVSDEIVAFGEVGLAGELRSVRGVAERIAEAVRLGYTSFLVPHTDRPKLVPAGATVYAVKNIAEAVEIALQPK
mgnify:CR=1 FL=1